MKFMQERKFMRKGKFWLLIAITLCTVFFLAASIYSVAINKSNPGTIFIGLFFFACAVFADIKSF